MAAKLSSGGNEDAMMSMLDGAKAKAESSRVEAMRKGAKTAEQAAQLAAAI